MALTRIAVPQCNNSCGAAQGQAGLIMNIEAHRWLMKAVGAPFERVAFDAMPGPGEVAVAVAGKAVIVPAVLPCCECDLCRRGLSTICAQQKMPGNDIQGGFASHIVVPARGLCGVDEARLAAAGLTLAQVSIVADALTTPYQAVRRAGVPDGPQAPSGRCPPGGRGPPRGRARPRAASP